MHPSLREPSGAEWDAATAAGFDTHLVRASEIVTAVNRNSCCKDVIVMTRALEIEWLPGANAFLAPHGLRVVSHLAKGDDERGADWWVGRGRLDDCGGMLQSAPRLRATTAPPLQSAPAPFARWLMFHRTNSTVGVAKW